MQQKAVDLGSDNVLPLSGIAFPTQVTDETELISHLQRMRNVNESRSPFVATSGHTDHFHSIPSLVSSVRSGVHLDATSIPSMSGLVDHNIVLDSYIYDYFNHQQVEALVRDHGIRRGEVWFLLDAFLLVLKSIRFGMRSWLCGFDQGVLQVMEMMEEEGDDGLENGEAVKR